MRKKLLLLMLPIMLLGACAPRTLSPDADPGILLTDCELSRPAIQTRIEARCGSFSVPENPSDPQGPQIKLKIAVVPSIKRNPEQDPLFVLAGGPGQSIIDSFPVLYPALFTVHETREIVLVDQRGTGGSNPLRCLDPEQESLQDEQVIAILKDCPNKIGIDPQFYTTDVAMRDLDRVRAALGYETVNLYGISYGTRAALVYLKLYPDRVRSVVLDAVVDPSFVLYQDAARDGQRALDMLLARCGRDPACHAAFPQLRSEFETLMRDLRDHPQERTLPHPVNGKPLEISITHGMVANIIFNTLYVPELVSMLPLAIHQAHAEGNFAPLITLAFLSDPGLYDGMFYAVACAEDAPLLSPPADLDGVFTESPHLFMEVCSAWPEGAVPEIVHAPVSSDKPILIFSGEADPITPPWHAERLAGSLPNSLHLIFPGMGHGNGNSQCGSKILSDFLESATTTGLDTRCVQTVQPPPFFVDFSGPRP